MLLALFFFEIAETPQLGRIGAQDFRAIRRREKGNLTTDERQRLAQRRPVGLLSCGAGEASAPKKSIGTADAVTTAFLQTSHGIGD